jgi:TM2 domain-containing membrane protein YozV
MNCAVHTDTPAAAFCRTCGKALCENCKRDVMGAIYCEPCIAARLQTPPLPPQSVVAVPAVPGAPNPGIAAFLGFIPGVGAMYNGQFAKAFIHVMMFVLAIVATSNISDWFGFAIPCVVFYMVFDAYKTAQAKQLGLPAPDLLGIDKMFGLQESQPAPGPGMATPAVTGSQANVVPGTAPAVPSAHDALAGAPTAALVLIFLGVIFLLRNFYDLHMHRIWPVFLIALGLWIAYKRTMQKG